MFKLTAMYPNGPDVHFDFGYYTGTHDRLAKKRLEPFGLERIDVDRGVGTPTGDDPPYVAIGTLWFRDRQGMEDGLAEHAEEILGDIENFSSVQPEIQISEVLVGE